MLIKSLFNFITICFFHISPFDYLVLSLFYLVGLYNFRVPVKIGGESGTEMFDLRMVPEEGPYTIPIQLPPDLTCSACTLMVSIRP